MTVPMGKMRVWNVKVSRTQKSYIFPNLVYFPVSYTCNHYISLDEKLNLHKVCLVQTCCKYQPCQGLHSLRKWWLPSLHILCKRGNHHFCNGCKLIQSRCLQQVCTRQTLCKFDFSSSVCHYIAQNLKEIWYCFL